MNIPSRSRPIDFQFGVRIPIGPGRNVSALARGYRLGALYRYTKTKTYPELTIYGRQLLYAKEIECSDVDEYQRWEDYAHRNYHK